MTVVHFQVGTKIVTGHGSVSRISAELSGVGARRVAVVADRGVADVGLLDRILAAAGAMHIVSTTLVDPDPDVAAAEQAAHDAITTRCDSVLAVGGGSGLCAAKAVAIRLTNPDPITAYEGTGRVRIRPAPTVAVPTTAGSGSEVSNALVLHEPGRDREIIVRGPGCEPTVAILDGAVLRDLPRTPMLYAALDALTHAMEALWTRGRSRFTDALAVAAADTLLDALPKALEDRDDETLQRLLDASSAANLACGSSGLGLVHALSSAPAVALPHGYQNGVLLPHVARFNRDVLDPAHRPYLEQIERLYDQVGFAGHFEASQIDEATLDLMLAASVGHPFRTNNARSSSDDELIAILREASMAHKEVPL
jgi:alcohol dehydrogenase class IV